MEWSITQEGRLVFLQNRPLEIQHETLTTDTTKPLAGKGHLLFAAGVTAAAGQASGTAYVVDAQHPLGDVPKGAILVLKETLNSAVRVLKQTEGVVAELGSVAGHFSTVCREFGVPLLLTVGSEIKKITHSSDVSLFADIQEVWQGSCVPEKKPKPLHELQGVIVKSGV